MERTHTHTHKYYNCFIGYLLSSLFQTPSSQGAAAPGPSAHSGTRSGQNSLSPVGELNLVPPLDRQFKKAPSDVKRRKPSKGHIKHMGLPPSYDGIGGNLLICRDSIFNILIKTMWCSANCFPYCWLAGGNLGSDTTVCMHTDFAI